MEFLLNKYRRARYKADYFVVDCKQRYYSNHRNPRIIQVKLGKGTLHSLRTFPHDKYLARIGEYLTLSKNYNENESEEEQKEGERGREEKEEEKDSLCLISYRPRSISLPELNRGMISPVSEEESPMSFPLKEFTKISFHKESPEISFPVKESSKISFHKECAKISFPVHDKVIQAPFSPPNSPNSSNLTKFVSSFNHMDIKSLPTCEVEKINHVENINYGIEEKINHGIEVEKSPEIELLNIFTSKYTKSNNFELTDSDTPRMEQRMEQRTDTPRADTPSRIQLGGSKFTSFFKPSEINDKSNNFELTDSDTPHTPRTDTPKSPRTETRDTPSRSKFTSFFKPSEINAPPEVWRSVLNDISLHAARIPYGALPKSRQDYDDLRGDFINGKEKREKNEKKENIDEKDDVFTMIYQEGKNKYLSCKLSDSYLYHL